PANRSTPGHALRTLAACATEVPRLVTVLGEPRASLRDRPRIRFAHQAGPAVLHDLERPAGIACGDHRLLREKRLVRNHSEVLVHRRIEDSEAARVQISELAGIHAACEADAAIEAQPCGDRL